MFKYLLTLLSLSFISNTVIAALGINGGPCQYNTFSSAITAASAGDTIYVPPGNYISFIGEIDKSLTFVPSTSGTPGFTGCELELNTTDLDAVTINGNGASHAAEGGLGKIINGAEVTFRHITLRNATANNGGILAVLNGSTLILDSASVREGTATNDGGLLYIDGTGGTPSRLEAFGGSELLYGDAVRNGGAVAINNSELYAAGALFGGTGAASKSMAGQHGGIIYMLNSEADVYNSNSYFHYGEAGVDGGAIYADQSNLFIQHSEIRHNNATINGGGIAQHQGVIELRYASVRGNQSFSNMEHNGGGGIYVAGDSATTVIYGAEVLANLANKNGGGILSVDGSQITINNGAEIRDNVAFADGAGVFSSAEVTINDAILINNTSFGVGGGLACVFCTELIIESGTEITENEADQGGGLYVMREFNDISQITASSIINNEASDPNEGFGGGLFLASGSINITGSELSDNIAKVSGGGMYAKKEGSYSLKDISLANVVMADNLTTDSSTNEGGAGAFIYGADLISLDEVLVSRNDSDNLGGGFIVHSSESFIINNSVFNQNYASLGSGIYGANTPLFITNSQFESNTARSGGAVYSFNSELTITNSEFNLNQGNYGGAIRLTLSDASIENTQFTSNYAETSGGAIYTSNSHLNIFSEYGLDDLSCDTASLPFNNYCTSFIDNSADEYGGAIYTTNNSVTNNETIQLRNLYFTENTAMLGGAVMYFTSDDQSEFSIQNILMHHNGSVVDEVPMIEALVENSIEMTSLTVVDNNGSPLWLDSLGTQFSLTNSIFYDNNLGPYVDFTIDFDRECNNIQSPESGSQSMGGNLGDPLFVITERGPYGLSANSPSLDACNSGPTNDLNGDFRPGNNQLYDQGAVEMDGIGLEDVIFKGHFE